MTWPSPQVGIQLDGLVVERVVVGSVAHECAILDRGDRIVAVDENAVSNEADLFFALGRLCTGPSICVTFAKPILLCDSNRIEKVMFSTLPSSLLSAAHHSKETVRKNLFDWKQQVVRSFVWKIATKR
jgi:hypothetical protein